MNAYHFGLIGFPLSHSFSEQYFSNKFKNENISNCRYKLFPLKTIKEFNKLLINNSRLRGLNVTIPYKTSVIKYLDELSPEAEEIGAVNTIKILRQGDEIYCKGYNTDIFGFQTALGDINRKFRSALILGTGGASKAVEYVLRTLNAEVTFVTRSAGNLSNVLNYNDLNRNIIQGVDLIVNTTPLGMFPKKELSPDIPYHALTDKHLLFDLIYNPADTLFMKKGRRQGAKVTNGLSMLKYQAEKAWSVFGI
ncbi:MAG: shikimate dehydrogenase [Bacteroidota bacterium]|nr:shikimate dehydrogenase [Bacteroidota bacterium]